MTVAICLKCGAFKHGAWTPCRKCGHLPSDEEDKAKHIIATDHHFSKNDLEAASAWIQEGKELQFNQEQVDQFKETLRNTKLPSAGTVRRLRFGCLAFIAAIIAVIIWLSSRA